MIKKIIATDFNILDIVNSEIKKSGNTANLNHIDVSQVKNMDKLFMFTKFNGEVSKWDIYPT